MQLVVLEKKFPLNRVIIFYCINIKLNYIKLFCKQQFYPKLKDSFALDKIEQATVKINF